jgi:hypothetical protein
MSKIIITETVLKNLINKTIKEVFDEAVNLAQAFPTQKGKHPLRYNRGDVADFEPMSMKDRMAGVPDPEDNPLSLGAAQFAREEGRIKAAVTKCLKGLSDEEVQSAYAHYKKNEMSLSDLPAPTGFVDSMGSDSDARKYLNGMMFASQAGDHPASSPAAVSWLLNVSKLLPADCEPEGI